MRERRTEAETQDCTYWDYNHEWQFVKEILELPHGKVSFKWVCLCGKVRLKEQV